MLKFKLIQTLIKLNLSVTKVTYDIDDFLSKQLFKAVDKELADAEFSKETNKLFKKVFG